ncbi:hypothetical protein EGW08_015439, partial [Elysia chlorotica]
ELYMNVERREERFDPQGYLRTTPKMKTMDLMYQMLDKAEYDGKSKYSPREGQCHSPRSKSSVEHKGKKSRKDQKQHPKDKPPDEDGKERQRYRKHMEAKSSKRERHKTIRPRLVDNSRRVVPKKEADRITLTVNKIFKEQDLDRLHVIHRYRPHSPDVAALTENGKVLGYTRHVGSALHGDHYVDFYLKEGLQTGKAEHSKRLQRLKGGKEKSDAASSKTAGKDSSSMQSQDTRHDWATKSRMRDILSPLASSTSYESVSSAGASGRRTPSYQQPIYTTFLSSTPMSSRASAGQELQSKMGYKVLSRIEGGKAMECIEGGRGEGDILTSEKWEVGCHHEGVDKREGEDDNEVLGAGSVSARQESRADLASSEDYCKFSTGKNTSCITESRQDAESVMSKCPEDVEEYEDDTPKVSHDPIYLRDVQMNYKRYRNPDTGFVLTGLGAAEFSPRGMSGMISARSTQSEPVKKPKRRSSRSRNNFPSEISPFPTTVSECGSSTTRTICSSSFVSSTPRKALSHRDPIRLDKDMSNKNHPEPMELTRAQLETPEIPRLGLTSDLNDTNRSLFTCERNEPAEDYTTAEQLVCRHPDTRASEGHVSSRAGERDYANKDGRAEEKCFQDGNDKEVVAVTLEESMAKDSGNSEMKNDPQDHIEPKNVERSDLQGAKTYSMKEEPNFSKKVEADVQSITSKSSRRSSKPDNETSATSLARAGNETGLTIEIERGEDEGRNTELDRGHETAGSRTGSSHREKKKVIERGDDLSETFYEEARLSQSARKRGHSQYRTTTKSERGLEREYFTPQTNQTEQYIIPHDAEMEDSLVDASELNSRPMSAASSDTSQISESKRKKKSLRRFSKSSNSSTIQKEPVARPASAASKDGRGDDSHSVTSGVTASKNKQALDGDGELHRPDSAASKVSNKTIGSNSSRGSVNGKDKPGKNQSYRMANVESIGRGLDDNSHVVATEMSLKSAAEKEEPLYKEEELACSADAKTDMKSENEKSPENLDKICYGEDQNNPDRKAMDASTAKSNSKHGEVSAHEQSFQEENPQAMGEVLPTDEIKNDTMPMQKVSEIISKSGQNKEDNSEKDGGKDVYPVPDMERKRHESPSSISGDVAAPVEERPFENGNTSMNEKNQRSEDEQNFEELPATTAEQSQNQEDGPSVIIAPQEKAFIDSSDTTEIVKAPVSACVSLEADNTVIDFRPSSASTAKSVTVDHESGPQHGSVREKQRVKSIQPSRIVEVTESEGTPTPGRDTHRAIYGKNDIIQTEYVIPSASMKSKHGSDAGQVLDLAQITSEAKIPEEMEVIHPGIKKRVSKSSINSKNSFFEDHMEKNEEQVVGGKVIELKSRNDLSHQNENIAHKERTPSSSSIQSIHQNINQRPPSSSSIQSIHQNINQRPPSASSQTSAIKLKDVERPQSASSLKSAEKMKEVERPPSASSQKSVEKVKETDRPPSASSQKSVEKVKEIDRPASASSQKSVEKVKEIERPPSASSQKSVEKVKEIERPPSASSQKSVEKVKETDRPPSASSQKSVEKVKEIERPPSASSQKSVEKVKETDRPPSASSQKSVEKVKEIERPPSASSQKSVEKVKEIERPPSASSQKSVEKVKEIERPPSASSQKSVERVKEIERPPSVSSQKSVAKVKEIERPPSGSSQKSVEKVKETDRPPSASSQKSIEKVKETDRPPSASSQKSVEKVKEIERPPSASSQKSVEKVNEIERPPSVSGQKSVEKVKEIERPPSASSQKSVEKVKETDRPSSASSQKSIEKVKETDRPPSVSSQKSVEKVKEIERPPSASSQKSVEKVKETDRPPSASNQKSIEKVKETDRPPSASSQKSVEKVKEIERPPSASSQRSLEKVKEIERPPSASSQKSIEKVKEIERPPSASSQKSLEKVKEIERPLSASSQKSVERVKEADRPPSASSQKSVEEVKEIERPPSASSQKSIEKVKETDRPPSASSQKSIEKVKETDRPPSASSQKSLEKVKEIERPLSASSQKSVEKVKETDRPPSASSQKSVEKVKETDRPPSASSQKSVEKMKETDTPPSATGQ